jgi:hypothetical protein
MKQVIRFFLSIFSSLFRSGKNSKTAKRFPLNSKSIPIVSRNTPSEIPFYNTSSLNPEYHPRRKKLKYWQKANS